MRNDSHDGRLVEQLRSFGNLATMAIRMDCGRPTALRRHLSEALPFSREVMQRLRPADELAHQVRLIQSLGAMLAARGNLFEGLGKWGTRPSPLRTMAGVSLLRCAAGVSAARLENFRLRKRACQIVTGAAPTMTARNRRHDEWCVLGADIIPPSRPETTVDAR